MPDKIKAGDVVVLRSGGPKMTVRTISGNGDEADLDWFDLDQQLRQGKTKLTSLRLVTTNRRKYATASAGKTNTGV